jgi:CheY-like chemotaxis protein/HPt (histidine-containing phosphotransfer) domain-containing protein
MVSDTGIGIPADRLESVFENFEQAATETTRKYGGTGLGLSITKTLSEMMGGSIVVSSEPEQGTTFRVLLTLGEGSEKEMNQQVQKATALQNHLLSGKTILVAEDNEINQKVIRHTLQRAGIVPTVVGNGKEAVELLEKGERFDLIILDLQMPLMNGFQTSTYIRKKLLLNTPIVAMTASALRNEKMKCFELGMNEYLTKPFEPAQLFNVLQRFLTNQQGIKNEPVVTARKETELYNLSYLYEMEDHDYFCEVLQLFLDTTPVLLSEIHEAALYENWEQVHKRAHKLKSSLGILQMNLMLGVIATIEQQAKEEENVERIPDGLKRVNELFELIKPMIQAELEKAAQTHA